MFGWLYIEQLRYRTEKQRAKRITSRQETNVSYNSNSDFFSDNRQQTFANFFRISINMYEFSYRFYR